MLPSSLIASSVSEFSDIGSFGNPAVFLWYSFFQSLGLFVFWPLCIFFLFKERVQTLLTIVFSMGLVCSVVNAFLFVVNYGPMDIEFVFFNGFRNPSEGYVTINFVVSLIILVITAIVLLRWSRKIITMLAIVFGIAFITLGCVNVREINRGYSDFQEMKQKSVADANDIKPLFSFSKTGQNIVVFMLDRAESYYFEFILKDRPELASVFDGFVYYKNTLAFHSATLMGSPGLYGGYEYTPQSMNTRSDQLLKDKHNEALLVLPRILTEQSDFTSVQTDTSWGNYQNPADMSFADGYDKIKTEELYIKYADFTKKNLGISVLDESLGNAVVRNLVWVSLFREVPVILRPLIYYRGTYFNYDDVVYSDKFFDWFSGLYCLPYLTDFGSDENSFMMITNETTHEEIGNDDIILTNLETLHFPDSLHYRENVVVLEVLGQWLELLKDNQVYDNTRIIIVSDHGIGRGVGEDVYSEPILAGILSKDALRGFLLYKDFNAAGSIQTDMTFMTTADVPTLALEGIVKNPINPFTGNLVNSEAKEEGVYVTIDQILWSPETTRSEYIFTVPDDSWYHVKDNIFIDSNWTQEVPQ